MWQCGYNVAKVDQKDQGYKEGIFQVETCRIREVYKTKPMANLTCFNVSSRTACGTLKIHMLPSTASINTCQTCCCQHIFKQVHATTCEVKSSFLMTSGEEKHLLCKEMNVYDCHFYAAASISGMHVLSYVTPFFQFLAHLKCTFSNFLAHLNCTFHLKASKMTFTHLFMWSRIKSLTWSHPESMRFRYGEDGIALGSRWRQVKISSR